MSDLESREMFLRELINEAMTGSQKAYVDRLIQVGEYEYNPSKWDHIFGSSNHIELSMPSSYSGDVRVVQALDSLGYRVLDYRSGTAVSKDRPQVNIERVFAKSPNLLQAWINDPSRVDSSIEPNVEVVSMIEKYRYEIGDYSRGILFKPVSPESIGSILHDGIMSKRIPYEIKNFYDNDAVRVGEDQQLPPELDTANQKIIITRDRYEVAEVGTNRRWGHSCFNIGGGLVDPNCTNPYASGEDIKGRSPGINAHRAVQDAALGCLAAYLVTKDDDAIEDPIARLSIKPFVNNAKVSDTTLTLLDREPVALGAHDKVYAQLDRPVPHEFKEIVHRWVDTINASQTLDGLYVLPDDTVGIPSKQTVYNYGEFKDTNRYFGQAKRDHETFEKYNDNIDRVPDELYTVGYVNLILHDYGFKPEDYITKLFERLRLEDVIQVIKEQVSSNMWGADYIKSFPQHYRQENPKAYIGLLHDLIQEDPRVINKLDSNQLVEEFGVKTAIKLYEHACKSGYDNYSLVSEITNEELVVGLLKSKKISGSVFRRLVSIYNNIHEGPEDVDLLRSIIASRKSTSQIVQNIIFDLDRSGKHELVQQLEDDIYERLHNLANDAKQAKNVNELVEIAKYALSMEESYQVPEDVYTVILQNRHVNSAIAARIARKLEHELTPTLLKSLLDAAKDNPVEVLNIYYDANGIKPEMDEIYLNTWYNYVKGMDQLTGMMVTDRVNTIEDPRIHLLLLKYQHNGTLTNRIISNIKTRMYEGMTSAIITELFKHPMTLDEMYDVKDYISSDDLPTVKPYIIGMLDRMIPDIQVYRLKTILIYFIEFLDKKHIDAIFDRGEYVDFSETMANLLRYR